MSQRPSMQIDERRPLAFVDTDTTDYYDEVGGIPPPHRLSGLYNSTGSGFSPNNSAFNVVSAPSPYGRQQTQNVDYNNLYDGPQSSHRNANMTSTRDYASAGGYVTSAGAPSAPNMRSEKSFGSYASQYDAQQYDRGAGDNDAFLHNGDMAERGRMSNAVAARERYMARQEARNSNPYAYGAGGAAAAGSGRGCFSGKRKWAWIGGAIVLIAAIVGIAVGVSMSKSKSAEEKGVTGVVNGDSNDPSIFEKDSRLHQSMYGMCYTPLNAQYPACGDTIDAVIEDVQLMSQLTTRLRLYGSDCQVSQLVLEAIQKTKVNMTVFLAAWLPQPADDPDNTVWNRQMSNVLDALKTYGSDHVEGVSVGNEYLLNGGSVSDLTVKMAEMRTQLATLNLPKTLPVGTADAGSMITTQLAQGSDFVMANVHPWFGGVPIDQAAAWTWSYTANQEPSSAAQASNNPLVYIAETGWPTGANETQFATLGAAVAGVPELNEFLSTYVCQANANVTAGDLYSRYFWFESFDEPFKAIYGGVETHWGLFNANKTLKDGVVIPTCSQP